MRVTGPAGRYEIHMAAIRDHDEVTGPAGRYEIAFTAVVEMQVVTGPAGRYEIGKRWDGRVFIPLSSGADTDQWRVHAIIFNEKG